MREDRSVKLRSSFLLRVTEHCFRRLFTDPTLKSCDASFAKMKLTTSGFSCKKGQICIQGSLFEANKNSYDFSNKAYQGFKEIVVNRISLLHSKAQMRGNKSREFGYVLCSIEAIEVDVS